jgi:redox-sensitive bicupin YhaK (pirin superfamily)
MILKINNAQKYGNHHISILYPGAIVGEVDTGIGSIGRIDHAQIKGSTTIKMHPHSNDEILSYFRVGNAQHIDSGNYSEIIGRNKIMLMKAGRVFYHEEHIPDGLEGLQIFIRPKTANTDPKVDFLELLPVDSFDEWRLLASNREESKLHFTSATEIYDMSILSGNVHHLANTQINNPIYLLYCFQGQISVNQSIDITKGESILTDEPLTYFETKNSAELVLFITDSHQDCYRQGMFSGNQYSKK